MDAPSSAGPPVVPFALGDVLRLRKPHPCGGREWTVSRIGADIGLVCVMCGHRILLERRMLERRIVAFVHPAGGEVGDPDDTPMTAGVS
jgi:hypothetical protein